MIIRPKALVVDPQDVDIQNYTQNYIYHRTDASLTLI